ncbi:MAG: glutamine-hydrolyzing carbamoyl-phosphate synthase small subunit [Myxococcales bacterium]|nr:glutamine-hydrolyzing carbamoyl-phosphate synthase small subunit [Myxococcales bacterium]
MTAQQRPAVLVLENGRVFRGSTFGPEIEGIGEVVFNTALSGYQEILSDPSYAGQIIVMTAPQIGNTGINREDMEAAVLHCRGLVVREASPVSSNWRSEVSLSEFLAENSVPGIEGIDTRAITRVLRDQGAMRGAISTDTDIDRVLARVKASPAMEGQNLASTVSCKDSYSWGQPSWIPPEFAEGRVLPSAEHQIVAYDFGLKRNILRELRTIGCATTVLPADAPASEALSRNPHGIFLSNGPGDPAAVQQGIETVRELVASGIPIFGICLGHQLLSLALGAKTYKLPFGHHGGNHPVMDLSTRKVEITSQNHGFAVDASTLPEGVRCSHKNLYDDTVEGIELIDKPVFSVQYHPEASPGPHDASYLFRRFLDRVRSAR